VARDRLVLFGGRLRQVRVLARRDVVVVHAAVVVARIKAHLAAPALRIRDWLEAEASTPTVMNAILDALAPLGVTDAPMPATPERIWRAMREHRPG
jgi:hypothetical protein